MTETATLRAQFTKPHEKFGVRVRVWSEEDLTGKEITVTRRNQTTSQVKLVKRVFPPQGDRPALYEFENVGHPRLPKVAGLDLKELQGIVNDSPSSWDDRTSYQKAAFKELARRMTSQIQEAAA